MDNIIIPDGFKNVKDVCPICHKPFNRTGEWKYKTKSRYASHRFFCSYKCFRVYQSEQQKIFIKKYGNDFKGVSK